MGTHEHNIHDEKARTLLSGQKWGRKGYTYDEDEEGVWGTTAIVFYDTGPKHIHEKPYYGDMPRTHVGSYEADEPLIKAFKDGLDQAEMIADIKFFDINNLSKEDKEYLEKNHLTIPKVPDIVLRYGDAHDIAKIPGDEIHGNIHSYAGYPGEGPPVFITINSGQTPELGNFTYRAVIHETGHALGLAHPHEKWAGKKRMEEGDKDDKSSRTGMSYENANDKHGKHSSAFQEIDAEALRLMYGRSKQGVNYEKDFLCNREVKQEDFYQITSKGPKITVKETKDETVLGVIDLSLGELEFDFKDETNKFGQTVFRDEDNGAFSQGAVFDQNLKFNNEHKCKSFELPVPAVGLRAHSKEFQKITMNPALNVYADYRDLMVSLSGNKQLDISRVDGPVSIALGMDGGEKPAKSNVIIKGFHPIKDRLTVEDENIRYAVNKKTNSIIIKTHSSLVEIPLPKNMLVQDMHPEDICKFIKGPSDKSLKIKKVPGAEIEMEPLEIVREENSRLVREQKLAEVNVSGMHEKWTSCNHHPNTHSVSSPAPVYAEVENNNGIPRPKVKG